MEPVIIVGGGVAGLSCLNSLLDKGVNALLLEAKAIGTPKICGEFIAPQAVSLLENWEVEPIQVISQVNFFTKTKQLTVSFLQPAGAISRNLVEILLAKRAWKNGGRIRENSLIVKTTPATENSPYIFQLASGETLSSNTAIFATGKYGRAINPTKLSQYYGIKMHFPNKVHIKNLSIYCIKDAYLGMIPIEDGMINCAGLIKQTAIKKAGSVKNFFQQIVSQYTSLQKAFNDSGINTFTCLENQVGEFGLKSIPPWPKASWIGDALISFPPAAGLGLAHGLISGALAAEIYLQNSIRQQNIFNRRVKTSLNFSKLIHTILLSDILVNLVLPLLQTNPWLSKFVLDKLKL